ncbi:MAG: glycosyltransferase [Myxococcales bacterium]|jgi:glycosyltransferase involved in cell wall biosynthesis|nr:glycosyltransferase [Myxococcales bacterium]
MRVALVHDWLVSMRGGERVLEAFCELFPQATLHTLVHRPGSCSPTIEQMKIKTSFLDRLPGAHEHHRSFWPLFAHAIESFDFTGFDLVLSSSSCVAKGVVVPQRTLHACYCHTPMRYVWELFPDYFGQGKANCLTRLAAHTIAPFWRIWDESSSRRVDRFIANSHNVEARIAKRYGQSSIVIPPPVDAARFCPRRVSEIGDYFLIVSALVPYKRVDLAIEVFARMKRPLKIVGQGPERSNLERLAQGHDNIEFVRNATEADVTSLFENCKALLFPGEEDAGITPLEAQAAGRPVIAFGQGGALETVIGLDDESPTGIFFEAQTTESLIDALERFEANFDRFDPSVARANAERFDKNIFKARIAEAIADLGERRP